MSKILKSASILAVLGYTMAMLLMTDVGEASASDGPISLLLQGETQVQQDQYIWQDHLGYELDVLNEDAISHGNKLRFPSEEDVDQAALDAAQLQIEQQLEQQSAETLHELVSMQDMPDSLSKEQHCLAGSIYFESKGETLRGQLAVAKVILARRDSHRFPDSICGVVYQRSQFSFVRNGRMPPINKNGKSWRNAVAIAQIALDDSWESPVEGALFFHARYVSPGWRLKRMATIDNHIFYR